MRPITRSCFLLLLVWRLSSLALLHLLGICLPVLWSLSFSLHAPALIRFFLAKVRLSLTSTLSSPHNLVVWTDGSVPFPFGKGGSGVLAYIAYIFPFSKSLEDMARTVFSILFYLTTMGPRTLVSPGTPRG